MIPLDNPYMGAVANFKLSSGNLREKDGKIDSPKS